MKYSCWGLPVLCCICICTCGSICGCNRGPLKPDGLPVLYPVTLQLSQEGKPLAEAEVVLRSDEIGTWACGGISDASGRVLVHTHGQFAGAPKGTHKVIVRKTRSGSGAVDTSGAKSLAEMRQMEEEHRKTNSGFGQTIHYVEKTYSDIETTPLEIEVKSGKNHFSLDVGPVVEIVEKHTSPMGR